MGILNTTEKVNKITEFMNKYENAKTTDETTANKILNGMKKDYEEMIIDGTYTIDELNEVQFLIDEVETILDK